MTEENIIGQTYVIIDQEKQYLDIYDVIKQPVQFQINKQIITALSSPINIDLSLMYNDDGEIHYIEHGIVYLSITNLDNTKTYKKETISFVNGSIKTSLSHNLSLGEYLLQIEYPGDRYYAPELFIIQFTVEKRKVKCIFEKEKYQTLPNHNCEIGITLIDNLNKKKINNCIVKYYFNDNEYITQTNQNGYALLSFTAPDIFPDLCNNNNNNIIYTLEVTVESNIYQLDMVNIDVNMQKYETEIFINNNTDSHIEGTVIAYDNNNLVNVRYGEVILQTRYMGQSINLIRNTDENGVFVFDIDYIQPTNNDIIYDEPFTCYIATDTITQLRNNNQTITLKKNEDNKITFYADVVDTDNNPILYGMVTFIITKNNEEIYHYVTEVNQGEAECVFNFSTVGEYQIQAQYHIFCEYQPSISELVTYQVTGG